MPKKKDKVLPGLDAIQFPPSSQVDPAFGSNFQEPPKQDFQDHAEQVRAQEANEPSMIGLPKAVIDNTWSTSGLYRASERNAQSRDFQEDPSYKVTDEELDALPTQYSFDNRAYLRESKSREDFAARQVWVDEDLKRQRELGAYGYKGLAAGFAGALLDPAMLPLLAVGGVSGATRGVKVLKNSAFFAAQAGVVEGALVAGDTQKGAKDVLHAIAFGGVLGGGMGAFGKLEVAVPKPKPNAHLLDAVNDTVQRETKMVLEADAIIDDLETPAYIRKHRENLVKLHGNDADVTADMPRIEDVFTSPGRPDLRAEGGKSAVPTVSKEEAVSAKMQVISELSKVAPESDRAMQLEVLLDQYNSIIKGEAKYSDFQPSELEVMTAADINTRHPELRGRANTAGQDAPYPAEATVFDADPNLHPPAPEFITKTETRTGLAWDEITRSLEEHRTELRKKSNMDMTGRKGAALRKELTASAESIKADIAEITETLTQHRATVAAQQGAAKSADELARFQFRLQGIEDIYRPVLEAAEARLEQIQGKLDAAKNARNAKAELESFEKMGKVGQIHKLYPEGAPTYKKIIETQHRVLDELGVALDASETEAASQALDVLDPMAEAGEMFDIITGEAVEVSRVRPEGDSIPAPSLSSKQLAERAEKVEALKVKSTTGLSTPDFLRTFIEKAKSAGASTIQWVPTQALKDRIQGIYTTLDHSKNQAFRGLNMALHESAQGGIVPEQTADAYHMTFLNQIKSAERNRWNEGYKLWSHEQGRSTASAIIDLGGHKALFNQEVFLKVVDPAREVSEGVAMAAEGHRDGLSLALEIRKRAGEEGWANIEDGRAYMPIVFESPSIVHYAATYGEENVIGLLSKSYQEGRFHLEPKAADKLAAMQFQRARAHQLSGSQVFKSVVAESEKGAFIASLKKSGVPEETILGFLDDQENTALLENISNRAKFSLGLNPATEHDGMRVIDLLYSDTAQLTQNYYRESAGGAALAMKGFRSYEHANRVINLAEEVGLKSGLLAKRNQEEAQLLRDSLKMMYGRPLDDNPNGLFEVSARRLMSEAATRALGMMGFAQFPETARAIANLGLAETLRQIPAVSIFRREAGRGGSSTGELLDPVMREVEWGLGYQGEDTWLSPRHIRVSEPAIRDTSGDVGRIIDNGLALGANMNNIMSGFQYTQGGAEKIVMRSISQKLSKMAHGELAFPRALTQEVGWTDEFLDKLVAHVQANPKTATFRGRTERLLNLEAMDNEMLDTTLLGMNRMKGRIIQREYAGDTNPFLNTTLGRVLSQFKRFSLVSIEKQLIHDLRGDKIVAANTLAWSSLLGYMAYTSRAHLKASFKADRDAELDKSLNPRAVALGTFNMMPQMAGLTLGADFMGTIGLLPDGAIAAPGRAGVHPMSGANIAPAAGVVADGVKFTHSLVKAIDGTGTPMDAARAGRRLLPLSNAIGPMQLLDVLTQK